MKTLSLLLLFSTVFMLSCKKEDPLPPIPEEVEDYNHKTRMDSGTYWVYDWFFIDSIGGETAISVTDSIKIIGDSIRNGNTYAHYQGTIYGNYYSDYLRDSLWYVINTDGEIIRSYEMGNEYDQLNSGTYSYTKSVFDEMVFRSVPYGNFNTYENRTTYFNSSGGTINNCGDEEFILKTNCDFYMGVIAIQYSSITDIQNCQYYEGRLRSFGKN